MGISLSKVICNIGVAVQKANREAEFYAKELYIAQGYHCLNEKPQSSEETIMAEEQMLDETQVGSAETLVKSADGVIEAAKRQQQLTAIYVDNLMKQAYKDGKPDGETNILTFKYQRPAVKEGQTPQYQDATVQAPLLSLVPVPAFLMDALTVDFEMEVKNSDMQNDKTPADVSSKLSYSSWFGLDASITGAVSSDSEHKRSSDSSATYKISARAIQQPPAEGMAKLTSLFAQTMEPIKSDKSGK
ncbi:hypothetical protein FACS1894137_16330 [Spirochaetia bacterium]|nr:hypothetical protein FACS1894137_16330 [Spirochaetia bacterium]